MKEKLEKIILSKNAFDSSTLSQSKETIFKIIPELKATDGFDQKHPHHIYDVWEHTINAMQKSTPNLQIRLALLLHDIGKPHSYQEENGVRHFKGHPQKSAEMAQDILTRLEYSPKEVKEICYLIENHDNIIDVNQVNSSNKELIEKLLYIQYCDAYAHHPNHIEKRIRKLDEIKEKIEERINNIQEIKEEKGER